MIHSCQIYEGLFAFYFYSFHFSSWIILDGLLRIGKKVIIDREECRLLSCITRLLSLRINYDLYRHMTVANITHAAHSSQPVSRVESLDSAAREPLAGLTLL